MLEKFLFENMTILSVDDKSFLNHRLPMAIAAKKLCRKVWVVCIDTGSCDAIRKLGFGVISITSKPGMFSILNIYLICISLMRIYKKIRPELVVHSSVQMSFYGSIASFLVGNLTVINLITGVGYLFSSCQFKASILRFFITPLLWIIWRQKRVTMVFQNQDDLDLFSKKGLLSPSSHIIKGSGVDEKKFFPRKSNSRNSKYKNKFVIGCASRLIRDKGIGELISAIEILAKKNRIELRIAGGIFPKNPSSFSSSEIDLWSKLEFVKLLGNIKDMVHFWQGCDMAILPSHREGLPKALLEAAACGLPLVGSDVPGIREIIKPGSNGLLFCKGNSQDMAAKIQKIISDTNFRDSAGIESRKLIERNGFSEEAIMKSFTNLLISKQSLVSSATEK